jgi:hypothetical protein
MKTINQRHARMLLIVLIFIISFKIYAQSGDALLFPWTYFCDPTNCDTTANMSKEAQASEDELIDTAWITNEVHGSAPYDIIYVDDFIWETEIRKIFVYTERRLIVIDEETRLITGAIDISNHGSQSFIKFTQSSSTLMRSSEKHLAYSKERHELYCLTQDLNIKVINPSTEQIMASISPGISQTMLCSWAILKYNDFNDQIYLSATFNNGAYFTKFFSWRWNGNNFEKVFQKDFNTLNDYAFNPAYDLLYISNNNDIEILNSTSGGKYETISLDYEMGVIFNAYNPSSGLNRIYCLPKALNTSAVAKVFVDGNTSPTYTINLTKSYFTCGNYNSQSNRLFFGYSENGNNHTAGVILYYADNQHSNPQENDFGNDFVYDMNNLGSKVFIACKNKVVVYNNSSWLTSYTLNAFSSYFYRITASSHYGNYIYATSLTKQCIEICNADNYQWNDPSLQCGGVAYHGLLNQNNKKIYFYNGHDYANDWLYIFNTVLKETQAVDLGFATTGIALYNPTNTIFICGKSNYIRRLNANNQTWLNPDITLPNGYYKCEELFIDENSHLFCSASNSTNFKPAIIIYNLQGSISNPIAIINLSTFSGEYGEYDSHFTIDNEHNRVFVSVNELYTNNGCIIRFNSDLTYDTFTNISSPNKIIYNPNDETIIVKHYQPPFFNNAARIPITVVDFNSSPPSSTSFIPRPQIPVSDLELDPDLNRILISFDDNSGDIEIRSTDGTLLRTVKLAKQTGTLKFNKNNNLLYAHIPKNYSHDRGEEIWTLNPGNNEVKFISLKQYEGHWDNSSYLIDLILDDESNKMYLTNAQGLIKIIGCNNDQITLQDRIWNWVSFPRLDRDASGNYPSEVLLDRIEPQPTSYVHLQYRIPQSGLPTYLKKDWDPTNGWGGDLDNVNSTLGYKLTTSNTGLSYLPMSGTILSSGTTFPLLSRVPNWTGYFLESTQSPFDAIGTDFLDKITWIAGQYWYCHKETIETKSTAYWWRCACEQGKIELKYADMIEIFPSENIPDFHWQTGGAPSLVDPKIPSQSFNFQEQPEYAPIMIELDTNVLPQEIGAFAGDSCIGATTVLPDDTLALICAYTDGFEGQEITFEMIYPTKSLRQDDDYLVLNTRTGIRERRNIIAGEDQPYFLVSFKNNYDSDIPIIQDWLQCRPNPANQQVTISYFIKKDSRVHLKLTDMTGRDVKDWDRSWQTAGSYSFNIQTDHLPEGIYQLAMSTQAGNIVQKLLIIH